MELLHPPGWNISSAVLHNKLWMVQRQLHISSSKNMVSITYDTWSEENKYTTSCANTNLSWMQFLKLFIWLSSYLRCSVQKNFAVLKNIPLPFQTPHTHSVHPTHTCDIICFYTVLVFAQDQSCSRNRECVGLTSHYLVASMVLQDYGSSIICNMRIRLLNHIYLLFLSSKPLMNNSCSLICRCKIMAYIFTVSVTHPVCSIWIGIIYVTSSVSNPIS